MVRVARLVRAPAPPHARRRLAFAYRLPRRLPTRADDKVDAVVDAGAVEAVVPLLTLRAELPLGLDGQPVPPYGAPRAQTPRSPPRHAPR